MAKRVADKELNHDNWNDEEEAEEAGSFQKASAETLQTRVFKQAKRKLAGNQEVSGVDWLFVCCIYGSGPVKSMSCKPSSD